MNGDNDSWWHAAWSNGQRKNILGYVVVCFTVCCNVITHNIALTYFVHLESDVKART